MQKDLNLYKYINFVLNLFLSVFFIYLFIGLTASSFKFNCIPQLLCSRKINISLVIFLNLIYNFRDLFYAALQLKSIILNVCACAQCLHFYTRQQKLNLETH